LAAAVRSAPNASLLIGLVSLAYFSANLVALLFPDANNVLAAIWPAGGIALAALLLSKRSRWPPLLAGVFIAGLAADLLAGRPLGNSLGFMTANVAESLTCALAMQRLCGPDIRFERTTQLSALVFVAVFCNAATALIGAGTAALAARASFWGFWLTWWISDGLGLLLVTPLVVSWARAFRRLDELDWKKAVEALVFAAIWYAVTWLILEDRGISVQIGSNKFIVFALLVYAALRLGMHGTTGLILLLSIMVLTSGQVREGGLLWIGGTESQRILIVQIFVCVLTITGSFLCAALSERKHAEKELCEAKAQLETIFNVSPLAISAVDTSGNVRLWNPAMEKLFDWPKEEVLGRPNPIVPLDKESEYADLSAQLMGGQAISEFETVRQRSDGALVEVSLSSAPIYDSARRLLGRMAIMADISQRKQAEQKLGASLAEKEILLRELYHRTKNNMHVIIALLNMQAIQCDDARLARAFDEAENRIYSMALVHQKLYESGDLSHINLKRYLSDLCGYLIANYAIEPGLITVKQELADIDVSIDTAIPCGLIANELVSNALRHAFPDGRRGTISVALGLDGDGAIALRIADDGIGAGDCAEIARKMGMGLKTVVGLGESQLGGRIAFGSGPGFACELSFAEEPHAPRV
jgi:PAS domain S-box-containing protein